MCEATGLLTRGLRLHRNASGWYRFEDLMVEPTFTTAEVEEAIWNLRFWIISNSPPPAPGPAQGVEDHYETAKDALVELYRRKYGPPCCNGDIKEQHRPVIGRQPEKKIIRNRAKCLVCGDVVESTFRHHYKECRCGSVAVDGGLDYIRRAYREEGCFQELSEYEY